MDSVHFASMFSLTRFIHTRRPKPEKALIGRGHSKIHHVIIRVPYGPSCMPLFVRQMKVFHNVKTVIVTTADSREFMGGDGSSLAERLPMFKTAWDQMRIPNGQKVKITAMEIDEVQKMAELGARGRQQRLPRGQICNILTSLYRALRQDEQHRTMTGLTNLKALLVNVCDNHL